uniref:putative transport permease Ycf38 n=1 Tax=Laurencia catarinensis TaxID=197326 RepID=UPI0028D3719B|nr:putative transport permease Ycf38 [Laurencia catarinensis]WMP12543.1 putative transport permease Ycf38 [Laurencia catarinensis]
MKQIINLKPQKKIYINKNKSIKYTEINAIVNRLYLQTYRRPSSIIIQLIQPLLWLILFGALFQNAPINLFSNDSINIKYKEFLNPGIIIFTTFNGAINSGLPIIFDREYGFLNRVLTSPIVNKKSLIYSCIIHTCLITNLQVVIIILFNTFQIKNIPTIYELITILITSTLIITNTSGISICNAFILPGHIEFIALTTLFINLPTLFISTALAPLSFMPYWLQIIVCMNPLTYAVEIIRQSKLVGLISLNTQIIDTIWLQIHVKESIIILLVVNIISFILVNKVIKYKYD